MSTVGDIAIIAAPAATALMGAFAGSRLQARSKVDEELRGVLDTATEELEQLAEAAARARSRFITEGARLTSDATRGNLAEWEVARARGAALRDRILIRTKPDDPVYVHYLNLFARERPRGQRLPRSRPLA